MLLQSKEEIKAPSRGGAIWNQGSTEHIPTFDDLLEGVDS